MSLVFVPKEIKLWVNTKHGEGLVLYIESYAQDNDIWTVINSEDGRIRHYNTNQVTASTNFTDLINIENRVNKEDYK